ncbi:MAG: lysozyme [Bacteroidales bacterium]
MKITENGLSLIKRVEGLRLETYRCSAGVLTIGYGHTKDVVKGMKITTLQADEFLRQDVDWAEKAVSTEGLNINQNQFDALVCFVFNVGARAFKNSSLLKMIRVNPNSSNIPSEFAKWRLAGGKIVPGLIARRNAEVELFLKK